MQKINSEWALLGALRFVLATIVVGAHMTWYDPQSPLTVLEHLSAVAAVIGFLLVSGYSIAHSLRLSEGGFYRRRVLRIMPLYIVALCFAFAISRIPGFQQWPHGLSVPPDVSQLIANMFFLQVFTGESLKTDVVVWTLAVEILFYGIAPLIHKAPPRILLGGILISAAAYVLYNRYMDQHFAFVAYGGNLVLFAWPWLLGFYIYANRSRSLTPVLAFAIAILCGVLGHRFMQAGWWLPVCGSVACLVYGSWISLPKALDVLLKKLGDVSYPLYLIHLPALTILYDLLGLRSGLLMYALCVAASWLLDKAVPRKIMRKAEPVTASRPSPSVAN